MRKNVWESNRIDLNKFNFSQPRNFASYVQPDLGHESAATVPTHVRSAGYQAACDIVRFFSIMHKSFKLKNVES